VIVDTSAIVAILREEDDADLYIRALASVPASSMSAGSYLETAIVVDANRDPVLSGRLDDLIGGARVEILPVTARQVEIGRHAYRAFGKGSGHPAGLNFGDCFAYALARDAGEPLLFKGDDFSLTDVVPAVAPR
jgi:ribonuclease VapC